MEPSNDDPLLHHFQRYLGEVSASDKAHACKAAFSQALAELGEDPEFGRLDQDVTVELVEANIDRASHTLVTHGMSRRPMNVPPEAQRGVPENFRFAELTIGLPFAWPLDDAALAEPEHRWPFLLLARLAQFPFAKGTWLAEGHSVPNGQPPQPYAETTEQCCALIAQPTEVEEGFKQLRISAGRRGGDGVYQPGKQVSFYGVVPIYRDELDFLLDKGASDLLDRLETQRVTEVVSPARRTAMRKRKFWFF
ncbi:MAG: suppressor of fused domain protein [Polyangiaceae bacterium]